MADLPASAAIDASRAAIRDACSQDDGPMERHGVRCFLLCRELARAGEVEIDEELLLVAGYVHDIGLYDSAARGGPYVSDGRAFTAELLAEFEWDPKRLETCLDAIERHHELRSQWEAGAEVELLRRADLIEVSGGLIRFGLPRSEIKRIFADVPRDGTYREIGRLVGKALRERPLSVPRIFLRGRG